MTEPTKVLPTRGTYRCRVCNRKTQRIEGSVAPCQGCGAPPAQLRRSRDKGGTHRRLPTRTAIPVVKELIERLEANGYVGRTVAQQTGISLNAISLWRRGKSDPSLYSLELVANLIGMELTLKPKESKK